MKLNKNLSKKIKISLVNEKKTNHYHLAKIIPQFPKTLSMDDFPVFQD